MSCLAYGILFDGLCLLGIWFQFVFRLAGCFFTQVLSEAAVVLQDAHLKCVIADLKLFFRPK